MPSDSGMAPVRPHNPPLWNNRQIVNIFVTGNCRAAAEGGLPRKFRQSRQMRRASWFALPDTEQNQR